MNLAYRKSVARFKKMRPLFLLAALVLPSLAAPCVLDTSFGAPTGSVILARFNSDGTLDASFGSGGLAIAPDSIEGFALAL